jgi:predicted DCC family thiol-disulfide oxidoreductase YuxK
MNPPTDNVILFDGVCNLCTKSVQFIIRHDRHKTFKFLAIQTDLGREIYRASGLDPDDVLSLALVTAGQTFTRSDAVLRIAVQFGGAWRLLAVFLWLPKGFRDWLYSFVAHRRYAWFGRSDRCMMPTKELESRFLS